MNGRIMAIPPGGENIARVAKSRKLAVLFPCHIPVRGDGTEVVYVSVYRPGFSCFRTSLRLSSLQSLSDEELDKAIEAKFPPIGAKEK